MECRVWQEGRFYCARRGVCQSRWCSEIIFRNFRLCSLTGRGEEQAQNSLYSNTGILLTLGFMRFSPGLLRYS